MTKIVDNKTLNAQKYAIHFDIHPGISYLNQEIASLIADLLPSLQDYPSDVRISQTYVDEGLDFCRVIFWVFSKSADAMKSFNIWFQALFRDIQLTETLEKLVYYSLDDRSDIEVELSNWTRILTSDADIDKAIQLEKA